MSQYTITELRSQSSPHFENIPEDLKKRRQWVLWRYEQRGEKITKVPFQPNGAHAKTSESNSWSDYRRCEDVFNNGHFDGLGFVFCLEDGLVAIDLDNCLDPTGKPEAWARDILDRFAATYAEITPSGKGFHIIGRGRPLATGARKWKKTNTDEDQGLEVYGTTPDGRTSARYFTMTGNALSKSQLADCRDQLDWFYEQFFAEWQEEPDEFRTADGAVDIEIVRTALSFIPADEYTTWILVGLALKSADVSFEVWDEWSQRSAKYDANACRYKWNSFRENFTGGKVGLGTLFHYAMENGFRFEIETFGLDDIGNAERLVSRFGDDIRWVASVKTWAVWNGKRWALDERDMALGLAKTVARSIYEEVKNEEG